MPPRVLFESFGLIINAGEIIALIIFAFSNKFLV